MTTLLGGYLRLIIYIYKFVYEPIVSRKETFMSDSDLDYIPCDCIHCRTGGGLPCIPEILAELTPLGE